MIFSSFWLIAIFAAITCSFVGVFVPVIPGPLLAWGVIFAYFLATPADELLPLVNIWTILASGAFVLGSFLFDYLASYWGAVKFGATWRGGIGALLGAIVFPLLFSVILAGPWGVVAGLLIGPIIGAFVGEYLGGNTCGGSARAGLGTLVGALAAALVKLFVCVLLFVWMFAALAFFE